MNSTDRQIDRALHILGSAAPREGMDQRLLARLKDRAATPVSPWRPVLTFAPPAAALLTAALLFTVFHHAQSPSASAITQTSAQTPSTIDSPTPQRSQPSITSSIYHASLSIPSSSIADKSANIDPAYLPSFPAPEAPLTADERRLVRLARHPGAYDVAQLEAPPEPLARQHQDAIGDFIHHMLSPLITAESFSPTPAAEPYLPPPADPQAAQPEPQPDSTSSPQ